MMEEEKDGNERVEEHIDIKADEDLHLPVRICDAAQGCHNQQDNCLHRCMA